MKKVVIDITPLAVDHWSGVQYLIFNQVKELVESKNNIEWQIFGLFPQAKAYEIQKKFKFKTSNYKFVILPIPAKFYFYILNFWQSFRFFKINRFVGTVDAYLSTGWFYLPCDADIKSAYIFDMFDYKSKIKNTNANLETNRINKLVKDVDVIFTISKYAKNKIEKMFSENLKIRVVYPGINKKFFDKKYGKRKYKNDYLIYAGSMHKRKNVERLLKALSKTENIDLIIVTGDYEKAEYLVEEENLQSRVKIFSDLKLSELKNFYHYAEALVYPSLEEGFGFPILEAKLSGTNVITSNATSTKEITPDSSILVNPKSIESIYNGIQKATKSKSIKLSKKDIENYSYKKSAKIIINNLLP